MKSKYTVDYFIKKFSSIHEDNWYVGSYIDPTDSFRRCALGHCEVSYNNLASFEGYALDDLMNTAFGIKYGAVAINDGKDSLLSVGKETQLLGSNPKERILNALELIKAGVKV